MLSAERQQAISRLVGQHGVVSVADLARQFEVSASTVRRDLEQLEKKGLIRRIHGGAAFPGAGQPAVSAEGVAARIGRAAAGRVGADETIYLGPGRLTLETAKALAVQRTVTVVTNSLDIAHWLANRGGPGVVLTGGTVRRPQNGLVGPLVRHALSSVRADRVIVEAAGISPDQGLTGADLTQAELCRGLIGSSGENLALIRPEHIGRRGGVLICPAADVDIVITGRGASDATLWDLTQLGITVVSA